MRIAIGTDHRGIDIKKEIINEIKNLDIIDCSKDNYDGDDYPDYAFNVCQKVVDKKVDLGILICGTGIGMSIAANKVKKIRCALVHNTNEAKLAKEHNNANVLSFGEYLGAKEIAECIKAYINAPTCSMEKHIRRVNKIIKFENGEYNEL